LNVQAKWSPDGQKVVFTLTKDGNSEIYIVDVRSGTMERLTHHWSIDTNPCFSPNGNEIAFTSDRTGNPQIYIMDVTGANVRRVTFNGRYNDLCAWSPKGDKIAISTRVDGLFQIATIDPTGDNMAILTSVGSNESPDWSPDGYHIVFSSNRRGDSQIYQMNWDGTDIRKITNSTGKNTTPTWSPKYDWNF
jgi:TolB protein